MPPHAALRHARAEEAPVAGVSQGGMAQGTPVGRAPRASMLSSACSSVASSQGSRQGGGSAVMVTVPAKAVHFVLDTSTSLASLVRGAGEAHAMQAELHSELEHELRVAQQLSTAAIGVLQRFLPESTAVAPIGAMA